MTKVKPNVKRKGPNGWGTLYKPEYAKKAFRYALLGISQVQMAACFGVSVATLSSWLRTYPKLAKALKDGGTDADGNVIQSLYTKAMNGDTVAMIFWLKNRQSELWRDRAGEAFRKGMATDDARDLREAMRKMAAVDAGAGAP